jgi:hypothetical protein
VHHNKSVGSFLCCRLENVARPHCKAPFLALYNSGFFKKDNPNFHGVRSMLNAAETDTRGAKTPTVQTRSFALSPR